MKTEVTVDRITLTREQVERAYKDLHTPEPPKHFAPGTLVEYCGNEFLVPTAAVAANCEATFPPGNGQQFVINVKSKGYYTVGGGYTMNIKALSVVVR